MTAAAKEAAKFVFHGTVKRVNADNVKAGTDTDKSDAVHVDEVVRAPQALAEFKGQDVTVQMARGERVKSGQQATFYTNGWIFGENLAVQSLGHDAVKKQPATARATAGQPHDPA